ncbi:MAG: ABC transporter ATP-binding protein [Candidatus Heimdallarchaeota archaeon]|nr:ABC transporter ATP-binding protein [Candidatus Heimdallarchaeota archaeon]
MSKKHKIIIEDLIHIYKGQVETVALRGVDLKIKAGEKICLVGKSGTGKSTLLHCIAGLLIPSSGKIFLEDEDITKFSINELVALRRDKIGLVYQNFNLIDFLTVDENIQIPMLAANKDKDTRTKRVDELLKEFDIGRYKKSYPPYLSGGEKQRVAVAVALANNPDIILADEPTGNLDLENATNIYELLDELVTNHKITLILATHDANALNYVDRKIEMSDLNTKK